MWRIAIAGLRLATSLVLAGKRVDLPADTFGQLPLFFTLSDGWSVEEEGGHRPIRGHISRSASTICLHASATAFEVDVLEAAVLGQSCKIFAFSRAGGWEYPARPI